jgi:hypothetical protein
MGRATHGVIGIRLKNKNDSVVAMTVVDITGSLFTMTENGFGKRSPIDEYRMTHRGSKGVRTIVTNERNGNVVFVSQVTDDHELIITTEQGMTVRIPVRDIREQGRNTMGVRIMRLNEGDKVVSVTQVLAEQIKEEAQTDSIESIPIGIIQEKASTEEQASPVVTQAEQTPSEKAALIPPISVTPEEKTSPAKKAKKTPTPSVLKKTSSSKKTQQKKEKTKKQKKPVKKQKNKASRAKKPQAKAKKVKQKKAKTKKAKKTAVKKTKPKKKPKRKK